MSVAEESKHQQLSHNPRIPCRHLTHQMAQRTEQTNECYNGPVNVCFQGFCAEVAFQLLL